MIATITRQGHKCAGCFAPWDCGRDDCAHGNAASCPTCKIIDGALESSRFVRVFSSPPIKAEPVRGPVPMPIMTTREQVKASVRAAQSSEPVRGPIEVVSIRLERAEGPTAECGVSVHDSWADANARLQRWARTAPDKGGYDKCDFKITWADGEVYEGRYDLTRTGESGERPGWDLAAHIRSFCGFGAHKPRCKYFAGKLTAEEVAEAADYAAFIAKYVAGPVPSEWWCCKKS